LDKTITKIKNHSSLLIQGKMMNLTYLRVLSKPGCEHFIKNKIFSNSMDETWEDVLKDLLEDSSFIFGKADMTSGHDRTNICGSWL
jgi:hypothetical protein